MDKGRILIVDDLPDWRQTLSWLLIDDGYSVKAVASIEEALRLIAVESFQLAILDVRLDETEEDNRDGLVLMRQIKERWPSIEVIILTGYAKFDMAQEAFNPDRNGVRLAYSFLEKTETDLLLESVKQAFQKKIYHLLSQGEQENVEFKSSIRWDYEKGNVNTGFQKVIAKSIVGMMNNVGGTLVIGVADDGTVLGIEKDLKTLRKPNTDEFELVLIEFVQNNLGLEYINYVDITFEKIVEKEICLVSVKPSPKPVFLVLGNDSEFWVRIRNSTRKLNMRDATEYIQAHWGK